MITPGALAVYKGKRALIKETGEKILISVMTPGEKEARLVKAREKDIFLLHPGPVLNFETWGGFEDPACDLRLIWELARDEYEETGKTLSLREAAELIWDEWSPKTAWAAYLFLQKNCYFEGTPQAIIPKSAEDVDAALEKQSAKEEDGKRRLEFLQRLKKNAPLLPEDKVFLQDVEALALGQTEKSRTMREAGLKETAKAAHKLLLSTGAWGLEINPYPSREDAPKKDAATAAPPPSTDEKREDLTFLPAYAIDNEDSGDPDDAVSADALEDGFILYVHVSDPACGVKPGSDADVEARLRGSTLYLPEGVYRMLGSGALNYYALGLSETSAALTFKLRLNPNCAVLKTEIFPSTVKVKRLTYPGADAILEGRPSSENAAAPFLKILERIAELNINKRRSAGAAFIDFPEVNIKVCGDKPEIKAQKQYKSAVIVRECMLLAGEGAAKWAIEKRLPFAFVSQETGTAPKDAPPGIAGSYQLRRCMRPRLLSVKPGLHWGLGLNEYAQVTSPLRRYTDLLCHQQIRAFLCGERYLNEDELLGRLAVSERGALAASRAERESRAYWTRVYLCDKIGSVWSAVVLEKKDRVAVFFVPDIALETHAALHGKYESVKPGDDVKLKVSSVNIAEEIVSFTLYDE
ncbi:MAG: RNB domain-containing ribonuclease [Spirochaetaceae bacterium]|jgi:exoribonuclease-2|nr:RNB domain-containing ribonuclease [Spirochaetaceae bacterium]